MPDSAKKNPARLAPREAQDREVPNSDDTNPTDTRPQGRFAKLSSVAIFDQALSGEAVRVLAAFATYADASGICRPAVGTIAMRLGVARRAVQKQMRKLESAGYLQTVRTQRDKGGFGTNTYRVHFPATERSEIPTAESAEGQTHPTLAADSPNASSPPLRPKSADASSEDTSGEGAGPMRPWRTHRMGADVSTVDRRGASSVDRRGASSVDAQSDHPNQTNEQKGYPPTPSDDVEAITAFDEFVSLSPKKIGRQRMQRAWDGAIRLGANPDELVEGMRLHVEKTPERFIEQPHNWLARRGWENPVRHNAANARADGLDFRVFDNVAAAMEGRHGK